MKSEMKIPRDRDREVKCQQNSRETRLSQVTDIYDFYNLSVPSFSVKVCPQFRISNQKYILPGLLSLREMFAEYLMPAERFVNTDFGIFWNIIMLKWCWKCESDNNAHQQI